MRTENEILQEKTAFYKNETNEKNAMLKSNLLMVSQINTQDPELMKKELENRKKDIKYLRKENNIKAQQLETNQKELKRLRRRIDLLEDEKTGNLQELS